MVQTTEQVTNGLSDYVKLLGETVSINTDALTQLALYMQALADFTFDVKKLASNSINMVKGSLLVIEERFDLIAGIQDSIFVIQDSMIDLITTLSHVAMFSIGVDLLHTVGFIVLGIYAISLGRKLKEKEDDIT